MGLDRENSPFGNMSRALIVFYLLRKLQYDAAEITNAQREGAAARLHYTCIV